MVWPFLYYAGERMSVAELSAARLDGDVVELGDAFMPADAVETRELRAGSLRDLVGADLALTHESAAWVHDALAAPPAIHRVQRTAGGRLTRTVDPRLRYRDVTLPAEDVVRVSGVLVTTLARTVADLVREAIAVGGAQWDLVHAVLASRPGLASAAAAHLALSGAVHHKRPALAFLRERAAQDDVTR